MLTAPGSENVEETISIESSGNGKFVYHSTHQLNQQVLPPAINVDIRHISAIPMERGRTRGCGEAVWKLLLEINGRLRSGTVAIHKAATGAVVADGIISLLILFIIR